MSNNYSAAVGKKKKKGGKRAERETKSNAAALLRTLRGWAGDLGIILYWPLFKDY